MPRTILALHAHPDDESSKGAGTVAKYIAAGDDAILVTATGGEAGDVLNPAMDSDSVKANLTAIREEELRSAAEIIGFADVTLLGYRDSGMPGSDANAHPDAFCNQPFESVLERLVHLVRREQPDVVLGYDSHEFYPHPDHLRVHDLSLALVDAAADGDLYPAAGDPWSIPKVYAPVFTRARIEALHEAMMDLTGESPFSVWIERLDGMVEPERRMTRIDATGYIDTGRAALRAHRTQVDPDGFWFAVPTEVVESVYPWEDFELLHSNVGWEVGESDLFTGVD